jgi:hypothetical protein
MRENIALQGQRLHRPLPNRNGVLWKILNCRAFKRPLPEYSKSSILINPDEVIVS